MIDYFISKDEQALIYKALVFYHDHPEYHDDRGDTLNEMIEAFRPEGVEKEKCYYCGTDFPNHTKDCVSNDWGYERG